MEFTYVIHRINTHEPTLNVEYYPDDARYPARIAKVVINPTQAVTLNETELADYVHAAIIQQAPYHEWSQDLLLTDLTPRLADKEGDTVPVSEAEVEAKRSVSRVVYTIEQARLLAWQRIEVWRNQQEASSVGFTYAGHEWDSSKASLQRLEPVLEIAEQGYLPPDFIWTSRDNVDVPVPDVAFLAGLKAAMITRMVEQGYAIHLRQRQMKQEIADLTTVDALLQYHVGWGEPTTGEPEGDH